MIGRVSIAIVVAAGLVGGGVAAATSSRGVKACVNSSGYLVAATKHSCPKGSHAATIGATGARGPEGDRGPIGPSTVYTKAITAFDGSDKLTLPAGSYAINWSLSVAASYASTENEGIELGMRCTLEKNGGSAIDQGDLFESASFYVHNTSNGVNSYRVDGPIDGTTTVIATAPVTLGLDCDGEADDQADAPLTGATYSETNAVINAIAAGRVVSQS